MRVEHGRILFCPFLCTNERWQKQLGGHYQSLASPGMKYGVQQQSSDFELEILSPARCVNELYFYTKCFLSFVWINEKIWSIGGKNVVNCSLQFL